MYDRGLWLGDGDNDSLWVDEVVRLANSSSSCEFEQLQVCK
jgi:hypothetical protein